jgi:predicted deacylase
MGLSYTMVVSASDTNGDFDSAAHASGCAMISCELGGGAKVSVPSLEASWHSVLRLLAHQGVLREEAAKRLAIQPSPLTTFLDLSENVIYVTAQSPGIAEPLVTLGEKITVGQPLILIRDLYKMDAAPEALTSQQSGIVSIVRTTPIVAPGDHLCVICPVLSSAGVDAQMTAAIP